MNLRKLVAAGATLALVAIVHNVIAQDDLDDLLKDLENAPVPGQAPAAVPAPESVDTPAVPEITPDEPPAAPEVAPEVPDVMPEVPDVMPEDPDVEPDAPVAGPEEDVGAVPAPAAADAPAGEVLPAGDANLDSMLDGDILDTVAAEERTAAAAAAVERPAAAASANSNAELIEQIRATEELRRKAYVAQAKREIEAAHKYMRAEEYADAAFHYQLAEKFLGGSLANESMRRACRQGVAESRYRAALQEDALGRRKSAIEQMKKAQEYRHPKARRQLELWNEQEDPEAGKVDVSELRGRASEPDYIAKREVIRRRLRRANSYYGTKELEKAVNECELVLLEEPYNQEAIRMREKIERKMGLIASQERKASREGMIAEVEKSWRPAYGVKAHEAVKSKATTTKVSTANDPEKTIEQSVLARMKGMKIRETIVFTPGQTIGDIVEYFRSLAKDWDDPSIPVSERGFGWSTITGNQALPAVKPAEDFSEGFGESASDGAQVASGPGVIQAPISIPNPTFYDALTEVLRAVNYKFKVRGTQIVVMPEGVTIDEMDTRRYPVQKTFVDKIKDASSETKDVGGFGARNSGGQADADSDEDAEETHWKRFLAQLYDIQWPKGSSIKYIESLGRLYVKNTKENLAKLELALEDMNAEPRLIEIEARFVEVCQEDLNSLGFEWILNSDYSLNLPRNIARALNIRNGAFGKSNGTTTYSDSTENTYSTTGGGISAEGGNTIVTSAGGASTVRTSTYYANSSGATWIRDANGVVGNRRNAGINAFGGESEYGIQNRYLSTLSNHISGESASTNDRFMRINAFLGSADLSMILHMLSQRSDTDLLSAPKVLTKSGESATIKVVTEYRYPNSYNVQLQSSSSSSSNSGGSQSAILAVVEPEEFQTRNVGVTLTVVPTFLPELNIIDLELNTEIVDEPTWKNYGMKIPFTGNASQVQIGEWPPVPVLEGFTPDRDVLSQAWDSMMSAWLKLVNGLADMVGGTSNNITYYDAPMEQPFFHLRAIESKVTVYPGSTIVMGGLITEQRKAMDDKIPFLGDLPFIGRLFRSHSEWTNKRNLLVFLSTRLIDTHGRDATDKSNSEGSEQYGVLAAPDSAN